MKKPGLLGLALSDFLFCLATICETFMVQHKLIHTSFDASVFFTMYGAYIQNCLINISTAVVTIMAVFRYFILLHPIKTSQYISFFFPMKIISVLLAFVLWFTVHIPLLWIYELDRINCNGSQEYFLLRVGYYMQHDTFQASIVRKIVFRHDYLNLKMVNINTNFKLLYWCLK